MNRFDVIVIGKGMIGAAAARYLSTSHRSIALIGPDEPTDWQTHQGVFASHYDQGRITRIIDPDPIWGQLAQRSIAAYPELEEGSGIWFHHRVGVLRASAIPTVPGDTLQAAEEVGRRFGAQVDIYEGSQLAQRFPFFTFPDGSVALWESGQAGYINPRSLVAAQIVIAAKQGTQIVSQTVTEMTKSNGLFQIKTDTGEEFWAPTLLVATGAFTNTLLEKPLDLNLKATTVLMAEISAKEAARLQTMPAIIYRIASNAAFASVYALPPIRYPNGKIYLKIGGTPIRPIFISTEEELHYWFKRSGSGDDGVVLQEILQDLLPRLKVNSFHTRPCVVTYTPNDKPFIDRIDDGLYIAVGGCGAAAKSSNEIGHVAALLVENGKWTYDMPAHLFSVNKQHV